MTGATGDAKQGPPPPARKRERKRESYTLDIEDVLAVERKYLDERREANNLEPVSDARPLQGLAFSGGGVRSATFCLGAMQALTRAGEMPRFDYLSTVSGGGYIGCCLSSLLTDNAETGLENERSPFTGLREDETEYKKPGDTRLSSRHQLHHLRTHGEYLIPRSRLMSRDVQRAVGAVLPGLFHTVFLFALILMAGVAAIHLGLSGIDQDLKVLAPAQKLVVENEGTMSSLEYLKAVPGVWFARRIVPPFREVAAAAALRWRPLLLMALAGALWCAAAVLLATAVAARFKPSDVAWHQIRAGWNAEDERESRFVWTFNLWSVVVALALTVGLAFYCHTVPGTATSMAATLVPLAMAAGGLLASVTLTHMLESTLARAAWRVNGKVKESRLRRSLYASVRGACIYGVTAAVAGPVVIVVLFALSDLPWKFVLALAGLAIGRYASRGSGAASALQLGGWMKRPLANVAVIVFLAFAFAQVSEWLLRTCRAIGPADAIWLPSLVAALAALVLFVALGFLVDVNRTSPHYFYRDRLTEAYLKTDARTTREPSENPRYDRQGMPLTVLRDCEELRLSDLGARNGRGPYHLIVAAMNLAGAKDLNRKAFLSEHFIFSRDYVGSRVTGWVDTKVYREGSTRLARAMAISAAAVGSAMGPNTFAAQAFVTTLLNARLGFWTDNPWLYRRGAVDGAGHGWTFWPKYLLIEALGLCTAQEERVNVSDGGHTGDNLGLLPLLQRRCQTIVVCDAEEDEGFGFGSFNNAVRLALTEENVQIEIALTPIQDRQETTAGYKASAANVVEGEIRYPPKDGAPAATGRLVYVKASIPRGGCPVHVASYAGGHPKFPHDTTADQFFDDAQFEAYRALGEHLGNLAVRELRKQP